MRFMACCEHALSDLSGPLPRGTSSIPSQFNEHWHYPEVFSHYARQLQNRRGLPEALAARSEGGKNFNGAMDDRGSGRGDSTCNGTSCRGCPPLEDPMNSKSGLSENRISM